MKEMLMLLAATMSKDEIVNRIAEACSSYNEATLINNEDSIKRAEEEMFVATNLFIMNFVTKGDIKNAINNIKQMNEIEKAHNFFKIPKN